MHRGAILALGFAMLILASCGGEPPPVVQVSGGGEAAQALGYQLVNLQNQVTALRDQVGTLQRRIDGLAAQQPSVKQP